MKKSLQIPYQEALVGQTIEEVHTLIDSLGATTEIDCLNWPELFLHKPLTKVYLAYTEEYIFVKWDVEGLNLRAMCTTDFERVSADSCVEFFVQVPDDEHYFNFEFNCIGTATASYRKGRTEDVVRLTPEELSQVLRYSSLPCEPFEEKEGEFAWSLCVAIPFSLINRGGVVKDKLHCNFYKCGDQTSTKHYVSWNPIPTEKPDFHRPEYFGEIVLAR